MKLKTNLKAGQVFQQNSPLQQAGGGGGQTANQSNPFAVNFLGAVV
jgi:hypothetical protein